MDTCRSSLLNPAPTPWKLQAPSNPALLSHCGSQDPGQRRWPGVCATGDVSSRHRSLGPRACCTHHPHQRWRALLVQLLLVGKRKRAPGNSSSSTWCADSGTTPGKGWGKGGKAIRDPWMARTWPRHELGVGTLQPVRQLWPLAQA